MSTFTRAGSLRNPMPKCISKMYFCPQKSMLEPHQQDVQMSAKNDFPRNSESRRSDIDFSFSTEKNKGYFAAGCSLKRWCGW